MVTVVEAYCLTYARDVVSAPVAFRASSNFSNSVLETSCSVLKNQIMNNRNSDQRVSAVSYEGASNNPRHSK